MDEDGAEKDEDLQRMFKVHLPAFPSLPAPRRRNYAPLPHPSIRAPARVPDSPCLHATVVLFVVSAFMRGSEPEQAQFLIVSLTEEGPFQVFDMLGELDADLIPEETLLQYFARMNVPSRVLDMGDAIFANDYAAVASEV